MDRFRVLVLIFCAIPVGWALWLYYLMVKQCYREDAEARRKTRTPQGLRQK